MKWPDPPHGEGREDFFFLMEWVNNCWWGWQNRTAPEKCTHLTYKENENHEQFMCKVSTFVCSCSKKSFFPLFFNTLSSAWILMSCQPIRSREEESHTFKILLRQVVEFTVSVATSKKQPFFSSFFFFFLNLSCMQTNYFTSLFFFYYFFSFSILFRCGS